MQDLKAFCFFLGFAVAALEEQISRFLAIG
jgi:hypothetical protein